LVLFIEGFAFLCEVFFYAKNNPLINIFKGMAKSISQAQAEVLSSGLLSNVGSDKSAFKPVKLLSEVLLIAGSIVKEAQKNLVKGNNNSTGELSQSLEITDPTQNGSLFGCDVTMIYYGNFVNSGVKGVKSGSSNAGYAFKNLGVSSEFIKSLERGRQKAAAKISNTNTSKTISQNEKKNAKISEVGSVWGAAVNIKKYGIKPTGFMDKAVSTIGAKVEKQLGIALRIDIENSLKNDN
jgi:hypothetical protein